MLHVGIRWRKTVSNRSARSAWHGVAGLVIAAAFAAPCVGCGPSEPTVHTAGTAGALEAIAELEPTEGNSVRGSVRFVAADSGVRVTADVRGLPPGAHGFHVHENGDCSAPDGSSAGPHYAFEPTADPPVRITGNLGELTPGAGGRATLESFVQRARLEGNRTLVGRAVVVHAKGNDASQPPDGAAGPRIACGVIEQG
jgi:Cu-Zn family superoxide dismutase